MAAGRAISAGRLIDWADSYVFVLVLVVATYIVSVAVTDSQAAPVVLTIQLATVWFTLRASNARKITRRVADIALAIAAVGAITSYFFHGSADELAGVFAASCLLYLIAPFAIIRHLIIRRDVDRESLFGAVAAYLLIGMFFAFAYRAAGELGNVPFFGSAGHGSLSQDLFFSFVTMTTVGYGNLVPAANPGQSLAVMEAVTGQLFLIVAVGKVINSFSPRRGGQPGSLSRLGLKATFRPVKLPPPIVAV